MSMQIIPYAFLSFSLGYKVKLSSRNMLGSTQE
jgi:hypothetical protein